MPKYLIQASYTSEGAKGVLAEGGTKRKSAVEKAAKSVGGKLESFYFAFGDTDAYVIIDAPDNASVAAVALLVGSSGAASTRTTVLLSPAEIDEAAKKTPVYRAPGN